MKLDQKGNTTFIGCSILFLLMGIFLIAINLEHQSYLSIGREMKSLLCLKKQVRATSQYIDRMEKINQAIATSFKVETISLVIPGFAPLKAGGAKFRRMMQILQQTLFFSEMKNKAVNLKKGCPLSKNYIKDVYKHTGLKLIRDYQGKVKLREKKWKETYYTKQSLYILSFNVLNTELKYSSQRVKLR